MKIFFLFLITIFCIHAAVEQQITVISGGSHTVLMNYDSAKNAEGIKRLLYTEKDGDKWQFFYFCGKDGNEKNKDKCGAWVDENGKKIPNTNNNVKRTEEGGVISNMLPADSGKYTRVPENPVAFRAHLARVKVSVVELIKGKD